MYLIYIFARSGQGCETKRSVTEARQVEVALANGKPTPQVCRKAGITEQTCYRWRKEYGGLKLEQAKRLKELEKENPRLKRLTAELSLEKADGIRDRTRAETRNSISSHSP